MQTFAYTFKMNINISPTRQELGRRAAEQGAQLIREAIEARGHANIIVATGASQFDMLEHLVQLSDIEWSKVTAYHLDEYVGMSISHPASFRNYLQNRFIEKLPSPLAKFYPVNGEGDVEAECAQLDAQISATPIDVAFVGIGENAHLAFNDPPADFETEKPFLVVTLDEDCRRQQMGEGWFPTLEDVPTQAISMSIQQILKSAVIIASVPDARKAKAVKNSLEGPITPQVPSSILQNHAATYIYLDEESASLLSE